MVVDLPKDVLIARAPYTPASGVPHRSYRPRVDPDLAQVADAVALLKRARRPVIYTGGGVINSGDDATAALSDLVALTGFPVTSTLMGLGACPASDRHFLGMLGMHGTVEANLAMHGCDVMLNVGARFDDRVTGRLDAFSPDSRKIHIDIDPSSINKNVFVDVPIVADAARALRAIIAAWRGDDARPDRDALQKWWQTIDGWRGRRLPRLHASRPSAGR